MHGALAGIRVLDFTQVVGPPYCTMLLADLGAEVIKIEERQEALKRLQVGPLRHRDGKEEPIPTFWLYVNRNKKSVTLNLKTPEGVRILQELIPHADVVVENFSVGTMDRLGIGYTHLRALNPRLIYASISAFGQYGPYAGQRGYDLLAEAISGYMSITGYPENPPTKSGQSIADYYAGLLCAVAILAALRYRDQTGRGQQIDIALLDSLISALDGYAEFYTLTGRVVERVGNHSIQTGPAYGLHEAQDGYVVIGITTEAIWKRFCQVLGRPELLTDPRCHNIMARRQHPDFIRELIGSWVRARSKKEVVQILVEAGVPAAPVNSLAEMVHDPQVQAREMFVSVEHPQFGPLTITGTPLKLSETPGTIRTPAPTIGAHNQEILGTLLGHTKEELQKWQEQGII